MKMYSSIKNLPSNASALHVVGERDIIGPDIELPLAQAEHDAVHAAGVDAHAHVHVDRHYLADEATEREKNIIIITASNIIRI